MKKYIFCFLLMPNLLFSQEDQLGIGVIQMGFPYTILVFHKDTLTKDVVHSIDFSKRKSHLPLLSENSWLKPTTTLFYDSYGSVLNLDIICSKRSGNWFEIIPNPKSSERFWLRKVDQLGFTNWNEYLTSKFCIRRIELRTHIFKQPNTLSDSISSRKFDCVRVIEVKGKWVKVKPFLSEKGMTEEKDDGRFGWMQWRDKDSLLINYYNN